MPSHVLSGSKHARSSSFTSHQVAHDPVVMASEIGQLPPYEFVIKQRDMVLHARTSPNHRQRQYIYRRRQIPELVIRAPLPGEEDGEPVELDEEELVPVDEVAEVAPAKRGGRPKRSGDNGTRTLFEQSKETE